MNIAVMGRPRTKKTAPAKGSVEQRLVQGLGLMDKTQAGLARAVPGLDADKVSKIVRGERKLDATELAPTADYLGVSLEWLTSNTGDVLPAAKRRVELVGYVGAGAEVSAIDTQMRRDEDDDIILDFEVPNSAKAVIVRGTSMLPAFEDGDVLIYEAPMHDPMPLLHRRCVIQLADGRVFVKRLRRGTVPGFYTLESFNAEPIEDVAIEWVAKIKAVVPR